VTGIVASRAQPSVLELLDAGALSSIDRAQGTDLLGRGAALLIAQTDGYGADAEIDAVAGALATAGGAVEQLDDAGAEWYLYLRRSGRGDWSGHWAVGEDVAVPRSALAPMLEAINEIGRRHGLDVAVVAHAGDGNLHPLLSVAKRPGDGGPPAALHDAADELVRAAIRLGGTISGEHGVGITKRTWLDAEIGGASVALQRRLKASFDPRGILNPHTWLAQQPVAAPQEGQSNGSQRAGNRLTAVALAAYGDDRS
jgi:glycolate oxidase